MTAGVPVMASSSASALLVRSAADRRRGIVNGLFLAVSFVAAVACIVPLAAIVAYVVTKGAAALNLSLLTQETRALGLGGGAAAAILGSLQMVFLAA
ncbi:MAG TPA: hypothetical protein VGJ46_07450, partial [Candidatus Limnocylindrales bacterium]